MHIEDLGSKTLLLAFDPATIDSDDEGRPTLELVNGATDTRIHFTTDQVAALPAGLCMVLVEGSALLHISIDDDFQIHGFEELFATTVDLSSITPKHTGYVETIPF